jgi:TetR/AcrR family transcriptional repressor of nem operon
MGYTLTQQKILSTAESLIQERGYNGFSYKDIANSIGIKTSSIHYHYSNKEDLGVAVIDWQLEKIKTALDNIINKHNCNARKKIINFIDAIISLTYKNGNKMCLGGMFASDILSLPDNIKSKSISFFNYLKKWLIEVLEDGIKSGEINKDISPQKYAKQILAQTEGALLLARLYEDESFFTNLKGFINNIT